ncbi:MAG: hypothetical protein AAFR38_12435 [Planctomycetota bacterium]
MGLDIALDELYSTGWATLDSAGCEATSSGRWLPGLERIREEFARAGFTLSLRHTQLFDCYRAEWTDSSGVPCGGVVGSTELEAAVYALAQLRRDSAATV